jgi:hypothetical protein
MPARMFDLWHRFAPSDGTKVRNKKTATAKVAASVFLVLLLR